MNKKECIKILSDHQAWRRGDDTKPMTDPKTLGLAIDYAIHLLKQKPLAQKE